MKVVVNKVSIAKHSWEVQGSNPSLEKSCGYCGSFSIPPREIMGQDFGQECFLSHLFPFIIH
jgi:hypothetical protein